MQRIENFVMLHGVTAEVRETKINPNIPDSEGDHWHCVIMCRGRQATFYYSQDKALECRKPSTEKILQSIAREARMYDDAPSFFIWAGDLDYKVDAETRRKYDTNGQLRSELHRILGNSLYRELTENVRLD